MKYVVRVSQSGRIVYLRQEGMPRRRRDARVAEMLALVQMADYARRRPHELSGGQKQRVAFARALAKMPKLLLLDEPLAALDRKLREETRLELSRIQQRLGTTFLVVTHDQEEAVGMATRIAVMREGRVVQTGTPDDIYERPNSRFVADFVGIANLFEGRVVVGPGGGLCLAIEGAELPAPLPLDAGVVAGTQITVALRPENLRPSRERPPGVALATSVASIEYQGRHSTIHCERRRAVGCAPRCRVPPPTALAAAPWCGSAGRRAMRWC